MHYFKLPQKQNIKQNTLYAHIHEGERTNMANLIETANNYVETKTLNIADLQMVDIDHEVLTKTVHAGEKDEFSYDYIVVNQEEYRLPKTVVKDLKNILKVKPDMKVFKVEKSGTGLDTQYTTIPL